MLIKVPGHCSPEQNPRSTFHEQVPKQGSKERVSENRFPGKVFKSSFPRIGCQEQVSKQAFGEQILKQVSHQPVFKKVCKQRVRKMCLGKAILKPGNYPRTDSQERVCEEQVPKQGSDKQVPHLPSSKVPKNKFARTGSQARPRKKVPK